MWFGPAPGGGPCNRFDAPGGEYRTCYLGDSPEVAFAETLVRQTHTRMVQRSQLDERSASRPGLVRLGVGAEVAHGHPYERCQSIALELWNHGDAVDGIEYRSRWDNDRFCVALFDRAGNALDAPDHTRSLGEPGLLLPILRLYDIGLA